MLLFVHIFRDISVHWKLRIVVVVVAIWFSLRFSPDVFADRLYRKNVFPAALHELREKANVFNNPVYVKDTLA